MPRTRLAIIDTQEEGEALPVKRFTPAMIDAWLLGRLIGVWPSLGDERWWKFRLADLSRSNSYLFITNGEAVLCARWMPHAMTMKPDVEEVFAFTRSARLAQDGSGNFMIPSGYDKPLAELYRHAREWARSLGAFRMVGGKCSDFPHSMLREITKAMPLADIR